jgi:hypothetical protein
MSFRTAAVALAATSMIAAGAPAALAQSTSDYPSDSASQTQTAKKKGKRKRGPRRLSDAQLTKVAAALGTDLATLKAAMADVKAAADATDKRETKAEMAAALAGKLGVTTDQLRAAFSSVRGTTDGRCKGSAGTSTPAGDYPSDT